MNITTQYMKLFDKFTNEIRNLANPIKAKDLQWFFKTGKGEYGEGDKFLGIQVPQLRALIKKYLALDFSDIEHLLKSVWHEERFAALLLLVAKYQEHQKIYDKNATKIKANNHDKHNKKKQKLATTSAQYAMRDIYDFYLSHSNGVNNWDLVDVSASYIVGHYLFTFIAKNKRATTLNALACSENFWRRRIAIIATHYFIRHDSFAETLNIAQKLLMDKEDLIHKAAGWMLREVGKRDVATLENFLQQYHKIMPRTMLRYAIERLHNDKRKLYLQR